MTNNTETFGCDKEQIIAFLSKVKKYFNQFIQCTYLDENCKPLEDCQCPDDASFVELCIGEKDPIKICLNPIKGIKIGQDENGNDVFADVTNSIADLSKCCPVAPIEIPATAFEDPENPTQSEVNTWITSNHPDAPPNTNFYYGYEDSGNPDDPDWVWSYDGNGNTLNIESPKCCEAIEHVQVPEGEEDPAAWIAENAGDYPAGTHFYTGTDPLNPTGVWNIDSNGDVLCDKDISAEPVHVNIPADAEDPAAWVQANVENYPPGTHFYVGDNPLDPVAVFTSDADFNIICDRRPPVPDPVHVMVPEGEDPATWIAANYQNYPADSHFYTGADPLNPDGVWNVDAAGNIMCDKRPEKQTMFCSGDRIPEDYKGDPIPYTYYSPVAERIITVTLEAGSTIPSLGFEESPDGVPCIHIDPKTGRASCVATNPFVSAACVEGTMQMLRCDGSGLCFLSNKKRVGGQGETGTQLSPADSSGSIVPGSEGCVQFTLPKCPVFVDNGGHPANNEGVGVRIQLNTGFQAKDGFQMTANSQFRPEFSVDNGASWWTMGGGGIDSMAQVIASDDGASGPEHEFFDQRVIYLPPGPNEICFRINWLNGTIGAGTLQVNRSTFEISWDEIVCCEVDSPVTQ